MLLALLGIVAVVLAAAAGVAVYRTEEPRSVLRATLVFGVLLVTPMLAFFLLAVVLTSSTPGVVFVLPLFLLGVGLYILAGGELPGFVQRFASNR
ncbi:hypothetical protein HSRCO_1275 [Halanaeroarchaeum sp. HSR-CO]|uniref:hypothetical protein n=1 Tax=Halanaeroarchaeum sp. HSR-CO TaxID=2866382 RepID=UPI00217E1AD8|nr:hypothetical protein [Halanaeroarchaeum sp. HSR-CO]UWG47559.1 hypothetical protein HSRCO_1275 [Halanaeroarchaeum sp. HSR-CO]